MIRSCGQELHRPLGQRLAILGLMAMAAGLVGAVNVSAHEAVGGYQPPRDIAEDWAKTLGFLMTGLAAGLIVTTLVFRRRRLGEPTSKWLLFAGVCVLPVPVMMLSTAVGLEQSKDVSFCSSCHVMDPFVDDLKNPESLNLAAVHFKHRYIQREQCYRCHTDYGILGNMEAKLAGLSHVWKASTRSYELPVQMSRPYKYTICLDCHGEAVRFVQEEMHKGIVEETVAGTSKCSDCHELAHPAPETRNSE